MAENVKKIGVIAGNFDVIHPGYISMFNECKKNCDEFVVFLQKKLMNMELKHQGVQAW